MAAPRRIDMNALGVRRALAARARGPRIDMNALGVRGMLSAAARRGAPTVAAPVSAPGAATPAGAAPYSVSNLPPDPAYDAAIATLQRQRDEQVAALLGERTRTLGDYGFTEGPNGILTFDVNNPMSKAAQLKRAYDTNRRATAQSMGAGGQLYSGAFQNAQDLVNRNQLTAEDAQTKMLQAFLAGNTSRRASALSAYETAAAQAAGDRLARFQTNPLYDPATADSTPDTPAQVAAATAPGGRAVSQAAIAAAAAGLAKRRRLTGLRIGRI